MTKDLAITLTAALAELIDRNRPDGAMCMSSCECVALEKAFINEEFDKVEEYLKKKLNKK